MVRNSYIRKIEYNADKSITVHYIDNEVMTYNKPEDCAAVNAYAYKQFDLNANREEAKIYEFA